MKTNGKDPTQTQAEWDSFVDRNACCRTCVFGTSSLFGTVICNHPELDYLKGAEMAPTDLCECHDWNDSELRDENERLGDDWYYSIDWDEVKEQAFGGGA